PGSAAWAAGLEPGDVLVKVGDVDTRPEEDWAVKFRQRYRGQAGATRTLAVQRAAHPLTLTTQVRERSTVSFTLKLLPSPSPKQAKIWRGLTTGSTANGRRLSCAQLWPPPAPRPTARGSSHDMPIAWDGASTRVPC